MAASESFLIDRLRNSRVAEAISDLENGNPVDVDRLHQLQVLDMVRLGQMAVVEASEREREFDEQLYKLVGYQPANSE